MQVEITGKVRARTSLTTNGKTKYYIVLESGAGKYPDVYRAGSEDITLFGPTDGFAAIGQEVTARCFLNAMERDVPNTNKKSYSMWLTLIQLKPVGNDVSAEAQDNRTDLSVEDVF